MSYKVYTRTEHHDSGCGGTFLTHEEALAFTKKELEDYENWGARTACIVHPDGKKEYWRTETKLTAVPGRADWCDESYTEDE